MDDLVFSKKKVQCLLIKWIVKLFKKKEGQFNFGRQFLVERKADTIRDFSIPK